MTICSPFPNTAGVAFAANHVATNVDKNNTARAYSKLESRLESEGRLDSDSALNLSGDDLKVMSKQMYYQGVSDRDSGLSYVDAKARNADTFLFDNEILSDRSFSVGSGMYHASAVNYIGVGAYSRAYGLNMSLSMMANQGEAYAWNTLQFFGAFQPEGRSNAFNFATLKNIPRNLLFANIGSHYAN